jgi:PhzF family phenazine biosynthesis protein
MTSISGSERNNGVGQQEPPEGPEGSTIITEDEFLSRIKYRKASPTDILKCVDIVKASSISLHPPVVGTSNKNALQYRQHHAAPYFRIAVYCFCDENDDEPHDHDHEDDVIVGFVAGIRVVRVESDDDLINPRPHDPTGPVLLIRSVVIEEDYQDQGLIEAMIKSYINKMKRMNEASLEHPIYKIVLLCEQDLLTFYIDCGFSVLRIANVSSEDETTADGSDQEGKEKVYYFLELQLVAPPSITYENDITYPDQKELDCFIVDSFAAKPGTGNPAAVVMLPAGTDPRLKSKWMQTVAAEFNLAETAFCWPKGSRRRSDSTLSEGEESTSSNKITKESHWCIRYYTPTIEMPLCGHATLASAAVLFQTLTPNLLLPNTSIVFHASEDTLTMRLADDDEGSTRVSKISMDFPPKPPSELSTREEKATVRNMITSAFSIELDPLYLGLSDMGDLLIELKPEAFQEIGYESLNYKAFFEWDGYYRGVAICCLATSKEAETETKKDSDDATEDPPEVKVDFLSRFFAPKAGIDEDPVTGSAHCTLGPYFSQKLGKEKVVGRQMSVRSGIVECRVLPDKVTLTGQAITTMNGRLYM